MNKNKNINFYLRELAQDLGRTYHQVEPMWRAMEHAAKVCDFDTQTELAESIAADFDLYTPKNAIPEAVFELAFLAMPAEDE